MNKKILIAIVVVILLIGAIYLISVLIGRDKQIACTMEAKLCPDGSAVGRTGPDCEFAPCPNNYKNITYEIEGKRVTLENETRYFGNEVKGDLNGDGTEDIAFLITQSPGGSGTFYYVVAALKITDGYNGINAILLGDRIAPQTTEFRNGEIIVNFADRKPGEPMTTQPSVGVSKYFKVVNNRLVENIDNAADKTDLIRVDNPKPNQLIYSPIIIKGEARGSWFFEASFPVKLYNENGALIATAIAQAKSDWMTEDFVPFEATLNFASPVEQKGSLILEKDNPSGLPEHDDQLRIPVILGVMLY